MEIEDEKSELVSMYIIVYTNIILVQHNSSVMHVHQTRIIACIDCLCRSIMIFDSSIEHSAITMKDGTKPIVSVRGGYGFQ